MMEGILAILLVLCCVLGSAVICLAIVHHASKDNSRAAQRRHEAEYAPVRDVYVVLQTTNHYTTHQDNRQVHIYGEQQPTLGTGSAHIEQGYTRPALPRQRKARCLPG